MEQTYWHPSMKDAEELTVCMANRRPVILQLKCDSQTTHVALPVKGTTMWCVEGFICCENEITVEDPVTKCTAFSKFPCSTRFRDAHGRTGWWSPSYCHNTQCCGVVFEIVSCMQTEEASYPAHLTATSWAKNLCGRGKHWTGSKWTTEKIQAMCMV